MCLTENLQKELIGRPSMPKLPSLIESLPIYVPGKPIEAVAKEYHLDPSKIAKLASNENPLGAPSLVRQAIAETLEKLHIYPDGAAVQLRECIAKKFGLEKDWVVVGNGSAEIIEMIAKGFLDKGDKAMFSQYGFAMYRVAILASNHDYQEVKASPGYRHNLKAFLNDIDATTKVIYIANPNNPTGTMLTADEMDEFVAAVPDHILIVIDEAYYEFVRNSTFPNSLKYIKEQGRKNVIVLRTFSKIYGLAGLRVGYGFAHPDVCSGIEKVRSPFNTNLLAQVGCAKALECDSHVQQSANLVESERKYMRGELEKLGLKVYGEEGNFVMVDVKRNGHEVFVELQKRGVIVRPLGGYDLPTCLRVSFGHHSENEKFINSLKDVLT
jgi:histidinol-phosphate aminotransferase